MNHTSKVLFFFHAEVERDFFFQTFLPRQIHTDILMDNSTLDMWFTSTISLKLRLLKRTAFEIQSRSVRSARRCSLSYHKLKLLAAAHVFALCITCSQCGMVSVLKECSCVFMTAVITPNIWL